MSMIYKTLGNFTLNAQIGKSGMRGCAEQRIRNSMQSGVKAPSGRFAFVYSGRNNAVKKMKPNFSYWNSFEMNEAIYEMPKLWIDQS